MSPWKLMLLPFLECLVLVGIHSYLGIHVIKRKVIFVDLALAQIAALGSIAAFMFGIQPHTTGSYVFSLLFTFLGAAVFSLTRLREERIPQEAVIGLVYALAAAIAILVIDRAPHGAEHIKEVLTGTILWVEWQTVAIAAGVYAAVGIFHYVFRDRFLLISDDPAEAYRRGIRVRLWDFLFYMSFGLVITLSVNTAGVLLVFVFLVVPAIMAISITKRLLYQLLIGWGAGTAVSFLGLVGSYTMDLPSGPTVVAVYGGALLLVALALLVIRTKRRATALGYIGMGTLVAAAIAVGFWALGSWLGCDSAHEHGSSECHHGHVHLTPGGESDGDHEQGDHDGDHDGEAGAETAAELLTRLEKVDLTQRDALLAGVDDREALSESLRQTEDEELRLALARRMFTLGMKGGGQGLLDLMRNGQLPIFRSEALDTLKAKSGDDFGYSPLEDPREEENAAALERWAKWLESGDR